MPAPRPQIRHRVGATLALAAMAVTLSGCLTMASRPTAPPPPTPTPAPTPRPTPTPTPGPPTPTPQPTAASYTVRAGDTLTSIARQFRTTPRSIAYWNRAKYKSLDPDSSKYAPNKLMLGWVLIVIPGVVYTPSPGPQATDAGPDLTPVPTEYLGPPTEPPSAAPSATSGG